MQGHTEGLEVELKMVEVVTVYEDHKKVAEAVRRGFLPWECLYCRQMMVVESEEHKKAYCTSCGAVYSKGEEKSV